MKSLEMLRALAALLVVFYHTQMVFGQHTGALPFDGVFRGGHRGVDLFFVLSGFIIAYVHGRDVNEPTRLPDYVFNRLARIYPAVWIISAFAVLVYAVGFGGAMKVQKLAPGAILASVLLLPQQGDALVNVTWTLKFEMFFYAMFAVMIVSRRLGLGLLFLWQAATLTAALSNAQLGVAGYYLRSLSLDFGVGIACAWVIQHWVPRRAACLVLLVVGVFTFGAGMGLDTIISWAGVLSASGSAAIIVSLVCLEKARLLSVPALLTRLGGASYSIYLVHFSVISLLAALAASHGVAMTDGLYLACACAAVITGLAFDLTVDRSVQSWLQQQKAKRKTAISRQM